MIGRESSYVDYMKAAPGFSVWQNFVPTKANFYAIGQIFIVANGQIMKQNQAIWSHCFAASPPPYKRGITVGHAKRVSLEASLSKRERLIDGKSGLRQ